ncbi:DUF4166 domain-containing protein [Rhizobium mongolense]|uniref:DUF4166 domain-containing protein n=1 Tax=Rhizobium mongolense TaxID=57676 RepID=A0ABR6IJB3_9HYPH|nr:DUF4166 domain-containing protein [Rhizobium mongolense]MBB4227957.1 hypothetical protein [Rhizobium mongolense]
MQTFAFSSSAAMARSAPGWRSFFATTSAFAMAVVPDGAKLRFVIRGWRFFGIPLPLVLAPGGDIYEEERESRFHFHVEVGGPLTGLIVRYAGWLEEEGG